jgi:hypothetical protein
MAIVNKVTVAQIIANQPTPAPATAVSPSRGTHISARLHDAQSAMCCEVRAAELIAGVGLEDYYRYRCEPGNNRRSPAHPAHTIMAVVARPK